MFLLGVSAAKRWLKGAPESFLFSRCHRSEQSSHLYVYRFVSCVSSLIAVMRSRFERSYWPAVLIESYSRGCIMKGEAKRARLCCVEVRHDRRPTDRARETDDRPDRREKKKNPSEFFTSLTQLGGNVDMPELDAVECVCSTEISDKCSQFSLFFFRPLNFTLFSTFIQFAVCFLFVESCAVWWKTIFLFPTSLLCLVFMSRLVRKCDASRYLVRVACATFAGCVLLFFSFIWWVGIDCL